MSLLNFQRYKSLIFIIVLWIFAVIVIIGIMVMTSRMRCRPSADKGQTYQKGRSMLSPQHTSKSVAVDVVPVSTPSSTPSQEQSLQKRHRQTAKKLAEEAKHEKQLRDTKVLYTNARQLVQKYKKDSKHYLSDAEKAVKQFSDAITTLSQKFVTDKGKGIISNSEVKYLLQQSMNLGLQLSSQQQIIEEEQDIEEKPTPFQDINTNLPHMDIKTFLQKYRSGADVGGKIPQQQEDR